MVNFAKGLKLKVTDREAFEEFVNEETPDPGVHHDAWGENSIPEAIYISKYNDEGDEKESFYECFDEHVNGKVSLHYITEKVLKDAIDEGVLEKDGYDTEFVERQ